MRHQGIKRMESALSNKDKRGCKAVEDDALWQTRSRQSAALGCPRLMPNLDGKTVYLVALDFLTAQVPIVISSSSLKFS